MDNKQLLQAPKIYRAMFDEIVSCEGARPWLLEAVKAVAIADASEEVKKFFDAIVEGDPESSEWCAEETGECDCRKFEDDEEEVINAVLDGTLADVVGQLMQDHTAEELLDALEHYKRTHLVGCM